MNQETKKKMVDELIRDLDDLCIYGAKAIAESLIEEGWNNRKVPEGIETYHFDCFRTLEDWAFRYCEKQGYSKVPDVEIDYQYKDLSPVCLGDIIKTKLSDSRAEKLYKIKKFVGLVDIETGTKHIIPLYCLGTKLSLRHELKCNACGSKWTKEDKIKEYKEKCLCGSTNFKEIKKWHDIDAVKQ